MFNWLKKWWAEFNPSDDVLYQRGRVYAKTVLSGHCGTQDEDIVIEFLYSISDMGPSSSKFDTGIRDYLREHGSKKGTK